MCRIVELYEVNIFEIDFIVQRKMPLMQTVQGTEEPHSSRLYIIEKAFIQLYFIVEEDGIGVDSTVEEVLINMKFILAEYLTQVDSITEEDFYCRARPY